MINCITRLGDKFGENAQQQVLLLRPNMTLQYFVSRSDAQLLPDEIPETNRYIGSARPACGTSRFPLPGGQFNCQSGGAMIYDILSPGGSYPKPPKGFA